MSHNIDVDVIKHNLRPLRLSKPDDDYDELLSAIGNAKVVMIGEASHGTHEFYQERALITQRLIAEKGFNCIALEADWPDAYRINRYVQGISKDANAKESLRDFKRFPLWMWRNQDVVNFVEWLKEYNVDVSKRSDNPHDKVGVYGLDLYSLYSSAEAVIKYLMKVDTKAAAEAKEKYECFERFGGDTMAYGYSAGRGLTKTCEREAITTLKNLLSTSTRHLQRDGFVAEEEAFYARINAEVVKDAEEYYRRMFEGGVSSWNMRDRHMTRTLVELMEHLERHGRECKVVIWAHNSHLGDARFTETRKRKEEINIGQLVRDHFGVNKTYNIGFTTYTGTVTAANEWDEPCQLFPVNRGMANSYEKLFHDVKVPNFLLRFKQVTKDGRKVNTSSELVDELHQPLLERAIGVVYKPKTERWSHYFDAHISSQFDAVIHIDETTGVEPLDKGEAHEPDEEENLPETYPEGL